MWTLLSTLVVWNVIGFGMLALVAAAIVGIVVWVTRR